MQKNAFQHDIIMNVQLLMRVTLLSVRIHNNVYRLCKVKSEITFNTQFTANLIEFQYWYDGDPEVYYFYVVRNTAFY